MNRILIVDDERSVRAAFAQILTDQGYAVLDAPSAETALAQLDAEPFDLVIMDVCLPGMDGLTALQEMRRRQPTLPVIVMTGQGTMQTAIAEGGFREDLYHRLNVVIVDPMRARLSGPSTQPAARTRHSGGRRPAWSGHCLAAPSTTCTAPWRP